MNPEEQLMMEQARAQIEAAKSANNLQQTQTAAQTAVMEDQERSMVLDQLDLSEELNRIEHLLRGHIIKRDAEGNEYWDETEDPSCPPPFNEHGVRSIMKFISFYLNKNKLLSNYDEETINHKMEDFSIELADMIFMKYREMGMDNPEKRKLYPIVVREIQDAIHDTYLRALGAKERDSLRKHWNITESMGNPIMPPRNNKIGFFGR
jgi:hypothetical protein